MISVGGVPYGLSDTIEFQQLVMASYYCKWNVAKQQWKSLREIGICVQNMHEQMDRDSIMSSIPWNPRIM